VDTRWGDLADGLRERALAAGFELRDGGPADLVLDAGITAAGPPPQDTPAIVLCAANSLAEDAPGLVLGRIACQLVNEAWFAIGEGVGSPEDVDAGLTLGLNHPRGPVDWGEAVGAEHVLAVLDGLWEERHEERYRAAPLLRRAVTIA
jgi:hypothetical protein